MRPHLAISSTAAGAAGDHYAGDKANSQTLSQTVPCSRFCTNARNLQTHLAISSNAPGAVDIPPADDLHTKQHPGSDCITQLPLHNS
jgi:hypothetical protein